MSRSRTGSSSQRKAAQRLYHRRRLIDFVERLEDRRVLAVAFNSIQRELPTVSVTNADSLVFRATFNQAVKNVDTTDFVVTGTTALITMLAPEGAGNDIYAITVSGGNLASLNGTVGLNLAAGQDIKDLSNNALPTVEPAIDEVFTVSNTGISGNVYNDDNGNSVKDAGDTGLAGRTVYLDTNSNGVLDTTTVTPQTFSTSTAMAIPDNDTAATSPIVVSGMLGNIADVNVTVNITHPYDFELNVYLISPTGTRVELFTNVGSSGDNFTNTVLDDEASTLISSGTAPFTATYRPEGVLSTVDGGNPNGTWKLECTDIWSGNVGTLNSWSITILPTPTPETFTTTDSSGNFTFFGLAAGSYNVRQVLPSLWKQTSPLGGAARITTVTAGQMTTGCDLGTQTNNVNVSVAPANTPEDSAAALIYTFTHGGTTSADLTVDFSLTGSATAGTDYTVSGATTFSNATGVGTIVIPAGSSTAALTVTPIADPVFELDETVTAVVAGGSRYDLGNPSFAIGTIANDDNANVSITAPASFALVETGSTGTFSVVLTSQPTASVTMPISSSDTTEATVAPASLVFTTANWNVPQSVTATSVDDFLDDGDISFNIVIGALVSADNLFNGFNPADIPAVTTDNETAGIAVTPVSGLTTTEAGGTATFTVALQSQPTASVTITVASLNPLEGSSSTASLVFTTANWNIAQTVTITGVNDAIVDGDMAYTIQLGNAVSTDVLYSGMNPSDVSVTNTDLTTLGFLVNSVGGTSTTESGGTAAFTVVLTGQPTADVTLPVASLNTSEGTIAVSSLTFTATNWNVPKFVLVTGVDDTIDDGNIGYTIQLGVAASSDARFNGVDPADLNFTNLDNDIALTVNTGSTVLEGGTHVITTSELAATDGIAPTSQLVYVVSTTPAKGQLEFTTSPGTPISKFTQADVDANRLVYRHFGSETTTDSFSFTVTDDGGGVTQVGDISSTGSSTPGNLFNFNGEVYFSATTSTSGTELWKSDGTAAGTVLVKDINPGTGNSYPKYFTNVNGTLFFRARDGGTNDELWRTDGTSAGTVLVKDIYPGTTASYPKYLTNLNGTLLFRARDSGSNYELWKSDGTAAGTVLVKDIFPGTSGSSPKQLFVFNGSVFFSAADSGLNTELWKSDGTTAGTVLVKDIYTGLTGSYPQAFANLNGTLFFRATESATGTELWKSDGTAAGTMLVKDIYAGTGNGSPKYLTVVNNTLFFEATDNFSNFELWKSDGTTTGTVLVKAIYASTYNSSYPKYLTNVNGTLFFRARDSSVNYEVWKSDGTTAGTVQVKDIYIGTSNADPRYLTNVNGTLFFRARDSASNAELWKSDGTTAGTVVVKEIFAGATGSYPRALANVNGSLFFAATDGLTGVELWRSAFYNSVGLTPFNITVTPVDDAPVLAVNSGSKATINSTDIITTAELQVTDADNTAAQLAFTVTTQPTRGHLELTTNPGVSISSFTQADIAANALIYVHTAGALGNDSFSFTLSDGAGGTIATTSFAITVQSLPGVIVTPTAGLVTSESGATASFTVVLTTQPTATVSLPVASLDLTEGTLSVTTLSFASLNWNVPQTVTVTGVFDAFVDGNIGYTIQLGATTSADPLYNGIDPSDVSVTNADTTAYGFAVAPTSGLTTSESGKTTSFTVSLTGQPTANVTLPLATLDATEGSVSPASLIFTNANWNVPQTVTVTGVDDPLDDGDIAYTIQLGVAVSSDSHFNGVNPSDVVVTNTDDDAAISANLGSTVAEGSSDTITTAELNVIDTGFAANQISFSVVVAPANGQLELTTSPGTPITRFTQDDINTNKLIYKHNGSEGTTDSFSFTALNSSGIGRLKDIYPGASGSNPVGFANVNGVLYFAANDSVNGTELWKTDGTAAGTVLVKDIYAGFSSSSPGSFMNVNGTLFFAAGDGNNGTELWKSDGTAAGTVLVKDIYVGFSSSSPRYFMNAGGTLFFQAYDGSTGYELWKSDGTAAGTVLVKDIYSGFSSSSPKYFTNVNGTLFFTASDGVYGTELWKTDGTTAGTVMVKDIYANSTSSTPRYLTNVNGTLFFSANESSTGRELWKSDGTTAGTVLVKDIYSGLSSSSPSVLTNVSGVLYFSALDPTASRELWKSDGTASGTILVKDIAIGSSTPKYITNVNGVVYFRASDGSSGYELWKSDGTTAGTVLLKDINPGSSNSSPAYLTNINGTLFFQATDSVNGNELWKSDGTTTGTVLAKDIYTGSNNGSPHGFTLLNGALLFSATDSTGGLELWRYVDVGGIIPTTTFNLTVTPVNDAPSLGANTGSTALEGGVDTITSSELRVNDVDSTAAQLTYTVTTLPTRGRLELTTAPGVSISTFTQADINANRLTYVHNGSETTSDSLGLTVSDGAGGLLTIATFSFTITLVNDAPSLAVNTGFTVTEGATHVIASSELSFTDPDNTNAQLQFAVTSLPTHGQLELITAPNVAITLFTQADLAANKVVYRHDSAEVATDSFVCSVSDGAGGVVSGVIVNVAVSPTNDMSPVITSNGGGAAAAINVAENSTAVTTVTATDGDLPAQSLSYTISGGADAAKFTVNALTGILSFNSAPNFEAPGDANADNVYLVTVQVSDGVFIDTQAVSVTVTGVNDNPPILTNNGGGAAANISLGENATQVTTLTATDADQPATILTYSLLPGGDGARFVVNPLTGALSFVTPPDFEAPADTDADNAYLVNVQVSDGLFTDTQSLVVLISAVDDNSPVITSDSGGSAATIHVAENTLVVSTIAATDADLPAPQLSFSIIGGNDAAKFTLNSATGALRFVAPPSFGAPTDADANNVYEVLVQVSDGTLTDTQLMNVIVVDTATKPPVITSDGGGTAASLTIPENTTAVTTVTATVGGFASASIVYSLLAGSDAAKFSIDSATGQLRFVTAPNFESPVDVNIDNVYVLTVQASDNGLVDIQTISVTVTNANDTPSITFASGGAVANIGVQENAATVATITASDEDVPAQTFNFTIVSGADAAKFAITSAGVLTFRAPADRDAAPTDANGDYIYQVVVQASDGFAATTQDIRVTLLPENDLSPVFSSAANVSVAEGTLTDIPLAGTDADLGPASNVPTFAISTATGAANEDAARFKVVIASGVPTLRFITTPDFESPVDVGGDNVYHVQIVASDNGVNDTFSDPTDPQIFHTTTQSMAISVSNLNDLPKFSNPVGAASPITLTVSENNASVITLAATDADRPVQALTFAISGGSDAAKFTINANSGQLNFVSPPDFETPTDANADDVYEVDVQVSDGIAAVTQSLAVSVTNASQTAVTVGLDAGGNIAIRDAIAGHNASFTISGDSSAVFVTNNTPNPDEVVSVAGIAGATLSLDRRTVRIPLAAIQATGQPVLLDLGTGDDTVSFVSTGTAAGNPVPTEGWSLDFGLGSDHLAVQSPAANVWQLSGTTSGALSLGGATGSIDFLGLENAQGGSGADDFLLTNATSANGFLSLDGGGSVLDRIVATRNTSTVYTLADNHLGIDSTGSNVDQDFSLTNIERAYLTGSSANDTFDVSGWKQHGDGTAANRFGGLIAANGGTDQLIKQANLTSGSVSDLELSTSDGMHLTFAGNVTPTVEDKDASPVTLDITGLTRAAKLIATGNASDEIVLSEPFFNVVFDATTVKVNQFSFSAVGFNSATVNGSANDQSAWFRNLGWTGTQTLNGGGGNDMVIVSADQNLTVAPALLSLGAAPFNVHLSEVEAFKFKAFDTKIGGPSSSHDNTVTLADWAGTGIIEAGDGNDQLVVAKTDNVAHNFDLKPTNFALDGKNIQLISVDDAILTGGAGSDTFNLSNWKGLATVDGGDSGVNSLSLARDRSQSFNADGSSSQGKITIKAGLAGEVDKDILYNNIKTLSASGGAGPNVFTLNAGYDNGLTATGFVLKPFGGADTLKLAGGVGSQSLGNIAVTGGLTAPQAVIGARTLAFKNATGVDAFEKYDITGDVAVDTATFTNFTGAGVNIDGAKSLTVSQDANFTVEAAKLTAGLTPFTFSGAQLGAGGIAITAGVSDNTFTVNGWTGALALNAATGTDHLVFESADPSITLLDDKVYDGVRTAANAIKLANSFELADLYGTGSASAAGQVFDVSGWTRGGNIKADLRAISQGGIRDDEVRFMGTSPDKDVDYLYVGGTLRYGVSDSGQGPAAATAKTWTLSGIDRATIDLSAAGNTKNFINLSAFAGTSTINGGAGNDVIWGGYGNDSLSGGLGSDWIAGGKGSDTESGGAGNDVVVGDDGADSLNGDTNNDLLIGGSTVFENNKAAIDLILAAWSAGTAATAKALLESANGVGTVAGQKVNLLVNHPNSNPQVVTTVFDDKILDTLLDSQGTDWLFFQGDSGTGDENGSNNNTVLPTGFELGTDLA